MFFYHDILNKFSVVWIEFGPIGPQIVKNKSIKTKPKISKMLLSDRGQLLEFNIWPVWSTEEKSNLTVFFFRFSRSVATQIAEWFLSLFQSLSDPRSSDKHQLAERSSSERDFESGQLECDNRKQKDSSTDDIWCFTIFGGYSTGRRCYLQDDSRNAILV